MTENSLAEELYELSTAAKKNQEKNRESRVHGSICTIINKCRKAAKDGLFVCEEVIKNDIETQDIYLIVETLKKYGFYLSACSNPPTLVVSWEKKSQPVKRPDPFGTANFIGDRGWKTIGSVCSDGEWHGAN